MHLSRVDLEKVVVGQGPESTVMQAHFQDCSACQSELATILESESQEGSTNQPAPARIKALDPITSLSPPAPAILLTASSNGLHLRTSASFVVGTSVQVRSSMGSVFGRVRYCVPVGSEFQIGVRVDKTA
jgi:hypothetical protein